MRGRIWRMTMGSINLDHDLSLPLLHHRFERSTNHDVDMEGTATLRRMVTHTRVSSHARCSLEEESFGRECLGRGR